VVESSHARDTFTDLSTYTRPLNLVVTMKLAADTEMLEAVCETRSDHWGTRRSRLQPCGWRQIFSPHMSVPTQGSGSNAHVTVQVSLSGEELLATIDDATQPIPLVALSETLFESAEGLGYRFVGEGGGPATAVEEIHVSGDYKLERRR
jgi:hypothetical protein